MDVRLPDGTMIQGVPDGMSKADLVTKLSANGYDTSALMPKSVMRQDAPVGGASFDPNTGEMVIDDGQRGGTANSLDAFVRGIGSGLGNLVGSSNMKQQAKPYKDQMPIATGAGELAAEIGATLPVGGALAKGVTKAASYAPQIASKVNPLAEALRTGGMSAGGMTGAGGLATRMAGGAATGGASAALIDPNDADLGAIIGAGLPAGGALLKGAGIAAQKLAGGMTGAGGEAMGQAFKAGQTGGQTAETFTKNMRGQSEMTDVLDVAKSNLAKMNADKQAAYRADMNALKTDKTVLDFGGIDKSLGDAFGKVAFKGQIKNEGAANYLGKAQAEIDNWKQLDPAEFHTPEGLDALKQKVGDILESIPFEQKTARSAVGDVYNGIKGEIKKQAPKYDETMSAYSEASKLTKEIEQALSLGQKASADTSMRKLQSLMRNNANTNYGNRMDLAGKLEQAGGQEIMPALAGQALNTWTPRGFQSLAQSPLAAIGSYAAGGVPAAAANFIGTSPRLAGELFYGAGKLAKPNAMVDALRQGAYKSAPVLSARD
jgi:hypothetical protein